MRATFPAVGEDKGLASYEADRLLMAASGLSRSQLVRTNPLSAETLDRYAEYVDRRRAGEPLQYIEGRAAFGPLDLRIDTRALIPRPETEQLWERVLSNIEEPPAVVVDLCTGSGNLALAMKFAFPGADIYGTDTSTAALSLARANGAATGLSVTWLVGDLFDALPVRLRGQVDVIVANPPYVAASDFGELPSEVRDHEPYEALVAGVRGDEILAAIAAGAGVWLRPGGLIACEIGEDQGLRTAELFESFSPRIVPDLTGRERFVIGFRDGC